MVRRSSCLLAGLVGLWIGGAAAQAQAQDKAAPPAFVPQREDCAA